MRNRNKNKTSSTVAACSGVCLLVIVLFILFGSDSSKDKVIGNENYPLIVLYHGKPEGAPYEWNTGVWTGWGEHNGDLYQNSIKQRLNWQAEAAVITKTCDVHCIITHDQSKVPEADGIVMELINHYKFFGYETKLPIPWPSNSLHKKQWLGLFQFESDKEFDFMLKDKSIMSHFDFTMKPNQKSDLPVSLICDWGYTNHYFLLPPRDKVIHPRRDDDLNVFVADFRGVIPGDSNEYSLYLKHLSSYLNIDFFAGPFKNTEPPSPYTLAQRINHMGQYMFVIIAESIFERDWVCPEFSQALLSGTVVIYFGAENIDEYLPGPHSIINARDFPSPSDLAKHIQLLGSNPVLYEEYFAWKKHGLSENFKKHLQNCAHYAECRICKQVLELNSNNRVYNN